jgi:hypothetical protein
MGVDIETAGFRYRVRLRLVEHSQHLFTLDRIRSSSLEHKHVRYFAIYEDDELNEAQMASWVKQAAALPGWDRGQPS